MLELFILYFDAAKKNAGKWVEGNIVLGAKPEEYQPSKEELILNEIGERIFILLKNARESNFQKRLPPELQGKDLCYPHFTFTHADVIGSGRFFYVESKTIKCFKL